jgi:hypothetical protein
MAKQTKPVRISVPKELLEKLDGERGDISRARYVLRIIEQYYYYRKQNNGCVGSEPL